MRIPDHIERYPSGEGVRAATAIVAVLAPLVVWPAGVNIVLVALALWACLGPARVIQAMALAVVVKFVNPGLVELGAASGPLLWLVLVVGGIRVLPLLRLGDAAALGWLWAFAAVAAVLSVANSVEVGVSLLKAITFVWVISTLFVGVRSLAPAELAKLTAWFAALSIVVMAGSAATLLVPSVAFRLNGNGLQGIFSHPQTLAIVAAPLSAASLLAVVLGRSLRPVLVGLAVVCWTVLLLTEARTGLFAAIAGTGAGLVLHLWQGGRRAALTTSRMRVAAFVAFGFLGLALFILGRGDITGQFQSFLLKRSGESELSAAFHQSRGAGIAGQWRNFVERPLTGNGFGVYAARTAPTLVVEFHGIPISAPVEKGFLPTAVLEETGILGGLLFALLLLQLAQLAWRSQDARWFGLFAACVATNVGEASMLSPGGPGLLLWCYIALAVNAHRLWSVASPAAGRVETDAAAPVFSNLLR